MKAAVHTLLLCSAACALHQPIIKRAPEPQMATKADSRGQIAKARRAVLSDGGGGFTTRVSKKKKKSEQKAPPSGKGFSKTVRGLNFDRVPNHDAECACGDNGRSYGDCCAPFHEGKFFPKTPAELTQARYTAFAYRLPDYLMETTDPEGEEWNKDAAGWKKGLLGFCDDFQFQKFELGEVIEGSGTVTADGGDSTAAELAQVSFKVDFVQKGTLNLMVLNEKSTFRKDAESGKWLYSKGEVSYDAQAVSLTDEEKERLMEKQREVNEEKEKELKQKEILKVAEAHDPDRGLPRKPPQMKGKIGKQM